MHSKKKLKKETQTLTYIITTEKSMYGKQAQKMAQKEEVVKSSPSNLNSMNSTHYLSSYDAHAEQHHHNHHKPSHHYASYVSSPSSSFHPTSLQPLHHPDLRQWYLAVHHQFDDRGRNRHHRREVLSLDHVHRLDRRERLDRMDRLVRHRGSRIVVGAVLADLLGHKGLDCGRVVGVGVVERMDRTKGMGNVKVGRMVVDHMIDRGFGRMIGHYRMGMEVVDRTVGTMLASVLFRSVL